MALWLCRAGRFGQHETKFIEDGAIYCTWDGLDWDMSKITEWGLFKDELRRTYPEAKEGNITASTGQLWSFSHRIEIGDIVALPSKIKRVVHFGEIQSGYAYKPEDSLYQHSRRVKWLKEIPRESIEKDILYSLGSAMTICKIERSSAEQRIRELLDKTTATLSTNVSNKPDENPIEVEDIDVDIEETALQEIANTLIAKYKGHGLAIVVAAILEAKGYQVYISPPGPDNGVDILASQGSLGFDPPRICVQVKSGDGPLERTVLDQLIGAMSNHKADFGMLVSWGGFKSSISREEANQFFKVRLWTHKDIIQEFLQHYESLPEEIRNTVPLKNIWIIDKK